MTAVRVAARQRRWLFAATVLVLGGLLTHGTYAGSGDAPHYLAIAHSLAFDRDLDLSNNYGAAEPLIGGGGLQPELHVRQGAGGVVRPVHDVGLPILLAPIVIVAALAVSWSAPRIPVSLMRSLRLTPSTLYRNVLAAVMILVAGVLATVMFDAFVTIGVLPAAAFWTALLVALSPPLLIYSILLFTELPSGLLCLFAFRRIALDDEDAARLSSWALAGAAAGLLLLVHIRNVGLVLGLILVALDRLRRDGSARAGMAFAVPLGVLLAVRTVLIHHMWGTWLTTPIAHAGAWDWRAMFVTPATRLAGLLLDQEFGLLPYAPIFILAVVGFGALARTNRLLAWRLSVVAGGYLLLVVLPISNPYTWTAGWSPAARFLVPIVPLLAICLVAAIRATPHLILVPILLVQIAIDAYMWQHPKDLWNDGDGVAAVCSRGGASFCGYLPSFAGSQ